MSGFAILGIAIISVFIIWKMYVAHIALRICIYSGIDPVEAEMHGLSSDDIIEKIRSNLADKDALLMHRGNVLLRSFRDEGLITDGCFLRLTGALARTLPLRSVRCGYSNADSSAWSDLPWNQRDCFKKASLGVQEKCREFRADLREHRWVFKKFFDLFYTND